jgi:class I fructose-bisphosphate aldolase
MFASVDQAYEMGAAGIGATIYFGSAESNRQIIEISKTFAYAHQKGLFTILWCYLRNSDFDKDKNYHVSADLTGQANHLGVTIEADIIKQKLPENNGGYKALNADGNKYGKYNEKMYSELSSDNPIDLTRYQLMNQYAGRIPLINSGGASGQNDMADAVKTAVINKRAGGSGLILGRKAFQKPFEQGVSIIEAVQSVYLNESITIV